METITQYADYIKPEWAPPAWLFGPVWSVLYAIIAITFSYVAYKFWKGEVDRKVALPFMLNIGFNIIFTYLQFELQNFLLASLDILLVLGTLVWAMAAVWKKYRSVALANIPYLLWVSFATVLQLTITYLNR
jgi:tryptophan-rich sensory protein